MSYFFGSKFKPRKKALLINCCETSWWFPSWKLKYHSVYMTIHINDHWYWLTSLIVVLGGSRDSTGTKSWTTFSFCVSASCSQKYRDKKCSGMLTCYAGWKDFSLVAWNIAPRLNPYQYLIKGKSYMTALLTGHEAPLTKWLWLLCASLTFSNVCSCTESSCVDGAEKQWNSLKIYHFLPAMYEEIT